MINIWNTSVTPESFFEPLYIQPFFCPRPQANVSICFLSLQTGQNFLKFQICGITQCVWLLPHSIRIFRFNYIVASISSSFLFFCCSVLYHQYEYRTFCLSTSLLLNIHFFIFFGYGFWIWFLDMVDKTTINIQIHQKVQGI